MSANPRDSVEHDDRGTAVWPEDMVRPPIHVEPRLERATWSHWCIAASCTKWLARGAGCRSCGAREIR